MSDAPTWYDLLDVPRDASTEDVRAAWKAQIADLEPGESREVATGEHEFVVDPSDTLPGFVLR